MPSGRLIPFARRSGFANMAIDEFMIAWRGRTGRSVARIYGWDPPAVTLGRYQDAACLDRNACRGTGVDVVRRITGGGAIFHEHEITYAVACGETDISREGLSVPDSFRLLNGAIISFYADLGLSVCYACDGESADVSSRRAPFCFSGRERYDLMIGGNKIGGNAQRRAGGTIFQHGSIPLGIDRVRARTCFAGCGAGGGYVSLGEALGYEVDFREASERLIESFARTLGVSFVPEELDHGEMEEIKAIMERRYLKDRWNIEGALEDMDVGKTAMAR
jgi:lipoate-protein ligase A